jgi:glycerate kinase
MAQGRSQRFLVAPDSFKGTFDAIEVTEGMRRGLEAAGATADPCPVADGGEGTAAALLSALGGEWHHAPAHDPLSRPIEAAFARLADGSAVVETAAASGLPLLTAGERDPERASTAGTGELIAAAAGAGAKRLLVAAGGSATVDGGLGAIEAIHEAGGLGGAELLVLCDVRTPFERAAAAFGPQKGADAQAVKRLAKRLDELAASLPRDPRGVAMTGCAGGLSGGLWAAFEAELRPGAGFVLDAVGFDARLDEADAVLTGEGALDAQTLEGKLVGEVARRGGAANKPVHAIVGRNALSPEDAGRMGLASVRTASTRAEIEAAARALVRDA